MKKLAIGFYLNVLGIILGVAGVCLTAYSSFMNADNAFGNLTVMMAAGILGVIIAVIGLVAGMRSNHNIVSAVSGIAAIALYSYVYGQCIIQRVALIAGLFSFNSGNTAGWQVFYMTIAAVACLVVGALMLVIGSFCKTTKTVQA